MPGGAPTPKGPSVEPSALPGVRVPTDAPIEAFGGGRADRTVDIGGVERAVTQMYIDAHKNATEVAVNDADNQLTGLTNKLLYDEHDGALQQRGKNAFDAPEKVGEGWTKGVSDISAGLGTDEQRNLFQHRVQARWQSVSEAVQRHVGQERKNYEAQTTQDFIKNRQDDAILNYTDPGKVDMSVAEQRAAIADHGRRNGESEEWITQQQKSATSKTFSDVIFRLLSNDQDLTAKHVYDAHKDDLTGAEAVTVDKAMQEGTSRGASQKAFDGIIAKPGINETDAIRAARDIDDPRVRDLTEQRVRQEFTERKNAATAAREQNLQNVADFIDQTGGRKDPPPAMWAGLTGAERAEADRWREQKVKGIQPVTNWTTYYDQMSIASDSAQREKFLHMNLLGLRSQLADPQFEQLTTIQASLRKGEDKITELDGYRTSASVVHDALTRAGINPNAKAGTPEADQVSAFHAEIDAEVGDFERNKGKKASPNDIQDMTDKLMLKSVVAGSGFSLFGHQFNQSTKTLFEQQTMKLKDIPPAEVIKIKDALRSYHQATTEANIISLYQAGKVKP